MDQEKQESVSLSKGKDLNSYEIMRVATRKPYKKTASPKDDCIAKDQKEIGSH